MAWMARSSDSPLVRLIATSFCSYLDYPYPSGVEPRAVTTEIQWGFSPYFLSVILFG